MRESGCGEVAVWGSRGVGELRCGGVAVWGGRGVRQWHCGGDALVTKPECIAF